MNFKLDEILGERPRPELERAGLGPRARHFVCRSHLLLLCAVFLLAAACGPAPSQASSPEAPAQPAAAEAPRPLPPSPLPAPVPTSPKVGDVETLSIQELKALLDGPNPPPVFDARPKVSYDGGHLPGAVSLPLNELDVRLPEVPKDDLSVFYCSGKTWGESYEAARELAARGYTKVKVLYGGISGWTDAGYPTETGP